MGRVGRARGEAGAQFLASSEAGANQVILQSQNHTCGDMESSEDLHHTAESGQ